MNKITANKNWQDIDELEGKRLEDGERLLVQWPSGKKEQLTIRVRKSSYEISDMGSPWTIYVSKAVAQIKHEGVAADVPLVGLMAKRIV